MRVWLAFTSLSILALSGCVTPTYDDTTYTIMLTSSVTDGHIKVFMDGAQLATCTIPLISLEEGYATSETCVTDIAYDGKIHEYQVMAKAPGAQEISTQFSGTGPTIAFTFDGATIEASGLQPQKQPHNSLTIDWNNTVQRNLTLKLQPYNPQNPADRTYDVTFPVNASSTGSYGTLKCDGGMRELFVNVYEGRTSKGDWIAVAPENTIGCDGANWIVHLTESDDKVKVALNKRN